MAAGLKTAHVPLLRIAGKSGLIIDGDWVESKDQDPDGDVRLLQLADIGVGNFLDRSSRFMTSSKARQLKCTYLEKGDILVARMPDPIGRACQFPGSSQQCVTVVDVCVLRPDNDVADPKYVTHILNSQGVINQLDRYVKGATRQRISRKNLEQIPIPLPPLPEQVRIATILEQADVLRVKRKEALAQLDRLTQSIFIEMFGDPNVNEKNWDTVKVDELCELVRGSSPRPQGDPRYFGGTVPRLMVADITRDGWLVTPRIDSLTEEGAKRSRPVIAGTVVMAVSGNIGLVSRLAVDACVHDGFVAFKNLDEGKVTPQFFLALLHHSKPALEKHKAGAIFINLTTTDIKSLRLITPPLVLQQEFNYQLTAVEKLKAAHRESLVQLDNLFASLQHRAFRGEL